MEKEQENFVEVTIRNEKVFKWVNKKLEELCQLHSVAIPDESVWKYGLIEKEGDIETILCQREFNFDAVGFILVLNKKRIYSTTVFLDLPDKFVFVKKERYKKEYYLEIPVK